MIWRGKVDLTWINMFLVKHKQRDVFWHTGIPGLWTQVLDAEHGDAGLLTLEAGLWTRDSGRWTLDCGCWALDSERWTLLLTGVPSFWFCLMSRIFCREYVLAWLLLEFLNKRYELHYKRTTAEKIAIWVTGLDQKKLSWTVQNKPSRAVHFRKFLKKTPLKKSPSLERVTVRAAILY